MKVLESIDVTASMITATNISEPSSGETEYSSTKAYNKGDEVILTSTHRRYISLIGRAFPVTFADPGGPIVVTAVDHGLAVNDTLSFITTGTLGSPLATSTTYYVSVVLGDDTFSISATAGGSSISGSLSGMTGSHTAIVVANIDKSPDTSPTYWRDAGPTNKLAPFDKKLSTKVSATTSFYYEITPGVAMTAIAVHAMSGVTAVRVQQFNGATQVYDSGTVSVSGARYALWDLLSNAAYKVKITFTGGSMTVGAIDIGIGYDIGAIQSGAKLPRKDYSIKQFDDYGEENVVRRPFSRGLVGTLYYKNSDAISIGNTLDRLRSKIVTWGGVQDSADLTEPFLIYGFWRVFEPSYEDHGVLASLTVEGAAET